MIERPPLSGLNRFVKGKGPHPFSTGEGDCYIEAPRRRYAMIWAPWSLTRTDLSESPLARDACPCDGGIMSILSALKISQRTALGFAAIGLCWGSIAALVPQLKAQIGASDAVFGTLLLASAFGLTTANWLAPWADRKLGSWGLPIAVVALAICFPLLGLAPSVPVYGAILFLLGVTSGLTDVLSNARVSELEAQHGRTLMNVNHAVFSVAYALAAVVAGIGREAQLYPVTILILPAILCVALATCLRLAPEETGPEVDGGAGFPSRLVLFTGLIVLAAFGSEAAIESWSALHIERTLGGGAAEGALGPAMLGLTMAIGRFSGQAAADRMSDWGVLKGATLLTALGVGIAAAAPAPLWAYVGFALAGLGVSVIGPIGIALAGRLVPPRHRTRAIARAAILGFCGFFVAPTAMGYLSAFGGLRLAFAGVVLFILTVLPLVVLIRRMDQSQGRSHL